MARSRFKHGQTGTNTDPRRRHRSVQIGVGPCLLLILAGVATAATPSATVPPSGYQSGLVNTPNPIDTSANLPITGNVLGGKHFRANIPYGSTTSFGAPLGSTSLDSFLRYSAVPEIRSGYPQNYSPYYSATGTVTTTMPGYQGVFSPISPRIAGGMGQFQANPSADTMVAGEVAQPRISAEAGSTINSGLGVSPRLRYWPMSQDADEAKDVRSNEPSNQAPVSPASDPLMTPEEYEQRLEQLRRDVEKLQGNQPRIEQKLSNDSTTTTTPPSLPQQASQLSFPPDASRPGQTATSDLQTMLSAPPRLELYDPSAIHETASSIPPAEEKPPTEPARIPATQRVEETTRAFDATAKFLDRPSEAQPGTTAMTPELATQLVDRLRNQAGIERAERSTPRDNSVEVQPQTPQPSPAKDARPSDAVPSPLMQKQFESNLAAARLFMKRGEYDRAADSFALASVYIPRDPRAHLGKSHALLASGKYADSAASLAKAVELDPRCALAKVDLVEVLGGPDSFVERVGTLEEQARANDASLLQFLLAYVYFQMDQLDEARNAIQAVKQVTPSSPAVNALAAVIDRATAK